MSVRRCTQRLLWLAAVGASTPLAAQRPATSTPRVRVVVVDSVTVVDVDARRLVPNQRIVIRGDRIASVEPVTATPPDSIDTRIDGRGTYVIPGLTDHHVHLVPGMDSDLTRAARGGVTMVQNMAGDNRVVSEYARRVVAGELAGPEIGYVSVMAGPEFFVDPRFIGASVGFKPGRAPWMQAVTAATDARLAVAAARGSGAEAIKLYAMIDSAVAATITAEAHRQGLRVEAHGTVFPARPLQLVQGGIDVLTHAPYLSWQGATTVRAPDAFNRRNGPYETVPASGPVMDSLLSAMRRAGTMLEPTLWVFSQLTKEPVMNAWAAAVTARAHALGIPILAGTDGLIDDDSLALPNVHRELQALVQAGLAPGDALAAATTVAARAMRRSETHGRIAPGYIADLVLLTADPLRDITATSRIRRVILRGRPLAP